ncbi:MAG: hypothetical protein IGQ45_11490 [Cyanobacterium sp. T60_A2020_053]|nr:hypothetical protein [Cyanobacterium sp. T60_A2020_053]
MSDLEQEQEKERDMELRQDALRGKKFSLADIIGLEGGGFLKGESPVPLMVQIKTEIKLFISNNLQDSSGALQGVLQNIIDDGDDKISALQTQPLLSLKSIIEEIINHDNIYYDFVKRVDLKYGQITGDRPYFQKPGQIPSTDDEYSHESVKTKLLEFLTLIDEQLK